MRKKEDNMGATKKEFKYFTILDHEKEEEYLREMHKHGWKLVRVTGLGSYHFDECEPEDVVYQLDYNQKGLSNKSEYIKMFEDCGWEHMFEFFGYSYFRKAAKDMKADEEIFNDNQSKKDMLYRVFLGRIIPLLAIFFLGLIPGYIRILNDGQDQSLIIAYSILIGVYVLIFIAFMIKYMKLKRLAKVN